MAAIRSKDELKSFLLTSRLIAPKAWGEVEPELADLHEVGSVLQFLERRQLLTPLQTGRILKDETEGLILGNYKLLYRNASGMFARVFRAATLSDNQIVALKLLRERWADDPKAVANFEREARIVQKFVHPNIVPIYDIGNEGRYHFFTMEFVEGGNLRDFMLIRKTLSPVEATRCTMQICLALEYALTKGASHRDLKLTNVLMSSYGVAKLVDFGLAGAETPSQAGTSDDVQRALEYSSLERGTNSPRNDPRSDLFFAGSIFYELLCGVGPWTRTLDREERLQLSRYTNVRPLAQLVPGLPRSIIAVCARMMEVNPSSRYQTAGEVIKDLRAVLSELGETVNVIPAKPATLSLEVKPDFQLLVVDALKKRGKVIREYFERHGFDILFMEDADEALTKLKSKPPDGILFLADSDASSVLRIYPQVQAYARTQKVPCLAVFAADEEKSVRKSIVATRFGATMFQPATLRDIRMHFEEIGAVTWP